MKTLATKVGNLVGSLLASSLDGGDGSDVGGGLGDERLVDVRDDTTASNGGLDEGVELLVTANGEQQVPGRDTLHLQVLASIAGKLEHLSAEVLHDGGGVDGSSGTDALLGVHAVLEETVDTTDGELETGPGRPGLGSALGGRGLWRNDVCVCLCVCFCGGKEGRKEGEES